jgi:hypothetical protein
VPPTTIGVAGETVKLAIAGGAATSSVKVTVLGAGSPALEGEVSVSVAW